MEHTDTYFRFLHAADLHLDSPLRGLSRYEGAPVDRLRLATRRALENLVELALADEVHLVVFAGDVFDGDWPDYNTGLFFIRQLQRLVSAGIRVGLIQGNHDAASRISRSLRLPEGVHLFPAQAASSWELEPWPVVVHGQSFAGQAVLENLALDYPPPRSGCFNLGLLHTSATGSEGHDTYAPCEVSDLVNHGYDYWALGHVHQRQVLHEEPWVVFSGNTQGRHANETGAKGCYRVDVGSDLSIRETRFVPLDVARWEQLTVRLEDAIGWDDVDQLVATELDQRLSEADGRLLCLRLEVTGNTSLHDEFQRDPEKFYHELLGTSLRVGGDRLWVERIRCRTQPPASEEIDPLTHVGPLAELQTVWEQLQATEEAWEEFGFSMQDVLSKLPPALKLEFADGWQGEARTQLLEEAAQRLQAELVEKVRSE